MSYQVLARKWRPKHFKELVGQEHVVTVLVNALAQQRLHHAYLFTGTRGVGKTTIARIFAKSLNCEQGISTEPCGQCDTCVDIDQGKFIDLLEIDAASRTKVDDTREILDNVQYAPTRGRYKVYLIDEVHMLSRSSFNALLKTLEEPPEHVKFILATTDPQKLPVTVLSRCLQFHLKALTQQQIEQKLAQILQSEEVECQDGTLSLLAKAARGSMRDSLSITDQAIAQGQGNITIANLQQMLGGVDQNWPFKLMVALAKNDSQELMSLSLEIASYAPNYSRLMADLIQLLHQIALSQIVEQSFDLSPEHQSVLAKLAQAISPEDVQLYYQIAVNGRKDLPYAGDEQAAFDMVMLRMLAFKPVANQSQIAQQNCSENIIEFESTELPDVEITRTEPNVKPQIDTAPQPAESVDNKAQPIIAETSAFSVDEQAESLGEQHALSEEMQAIEQAAVSQGFELNENLNTTTEQTAQQDSLLGTLQGTMKGSMHQRLNEPLEQLDVAAEDPKFDTPPVSEGAQVSEPFKHVDETVEQANLETSELDQQPSNTESEVNFEPEIKTEPEIKVDQSANVHQTQATENDVSQNIAAQFNSPVGDILATRNMLRSRKKQLESSAKKPNDAVSRQPANNQDISNKADLAEDKEPKVEPVSIAELNADSYNPEVIDPATIRSATQVDKWAQMIDAMELTARLRQLAIHATIDEASTDDCLKLKLDQATKHLKSEAAHKQLEQRISQYLSRSITVEVEVVEQTVADPYQIQSDINGKRHEYAIELIKADPVVNHLISSFDAVLKEETISAL